jgi:hypothetical protein
MEILPVIVGVIKVLIGILGALGLLATITSTIEYNQLKKESADTVDEARAHITRGFGIFVAAIVLYLFLTAVGPVLGFLF